MAIETTKLPSFHKSISYGVKIAKCNYDQTKPEVTIAVILALFHALESEMPAEVAHKIAVEFNEIPDFIRKTFAPKASIAAEVIEMILHDLKGRPVKS